MKFRILAASIMVLALSSLAQAAGTLPYTKAATPALIQNLQGLSPAPVGSACTTATGTKGTIVTVTTTGYIGLKWIATNAAGAPVVIKRYINSNTAYMPESGGTLALNNGISSVKFNIYSSASSQTVTVCRELQ